MKSRTVVALTLSAVAALGATGTTMAFADDADVARRAAQRTTSTAQRPGDRVVDERRDTRPDATRITLSARRADQLAVRFVGGGTVRRGAVLNRERTAYRVVVVRSGITHTLTVDATTGRVRRA